LGFEKEWTLENVTEWEKIKNYSTAIRVNYATSEGSRFRLENKVCQIGGEVIYTDMINYYLFVYRYSDYVSITPFNKEIIREVVSKIIEDSLILQEANDKTLISLNSSFFNNINIDYVNRENKVIEAEDLILDNEAGKISGELINMYFLNMEIPVMGIEDAKEIVYSKMNNLRKEIVNGNMSLFEAGKQISMDESLAKIDSAYQGNAYIEFNNFIGEEILKDPELNKKIIEMQEGTISEILVGYDYDLNGNWSEANYVVVKINSKKDGYLNKSDLLKELSKKYIITFFND